MNPSPSEIDRFPGNAAPPAPEPLLQPVRRDEALLREIEETETGADSLAVWWLGQSGYAFKWRDRILYVDLYLSEHLTTKYARTDKPHIRMTEAPLRGRQITHARLVLASHKHSDHLDPGTLPDLFAASPESRLLLPRAIAEHAMGLGLPESRLILVDAEETFEADGIAITPIPSAHEAFDLTPEGRHPYLGFLIRFGPISVYHSGDTIPYPGLEDRLKAADLDLAFVPINGRDARRKALGVPGNMTIEESVELCRAVQPRVVIPHHYDMFTFNTADAREFEAHLRRELAEQRCKILLCGERWIYRRGES